MYMKCLKCNKETSNIKFCSKSCANSHNNSLKPKRKAKVRICSNCNKPTGYSWKVQRTICDICLDLKKAKETKKDYINKAKYQVHSIIRSQARVLYQKSNKPKYCLVCKYNKHYEVCHIKAIKDFDDTDFISEINNLDNLIALCPNHHWEFDKGLISLRTIQDSNL